MTEKSVGRFISQLRKEKNMTQLQLAELLNISNRTVSKWENGDGYPDITILENLAACLEVSVDELLKGKRLDRETDLLYPNPPESAETDKEAVKNKALNQFRLVVSYCLAVLSAVCGVGIELGTFHVKMFYMFIEVYVDIGAFIVTVLSIIIFVRYHIEKNLLEETQSAIISNIHFKIHCFIWVLFPLIFLCHFYIWYII